MSEPQIAHTAELDAATLAAARALLADAFADDFDDHDWEHSLGGMHALVYDGDELDRARPVVQRRLVHRGVALRAGYVEGVGVRADHRRHGHGGALMGALEAIVRGAYDLGALGATDAAAPLTPRAAGSCGADRCRRSRRRASCPRRRRRAPSTSCRARAALDLHAELTCDWRDGDLW